MSDRPVVPPRQVEGFSSARALGLLPQVPDEPPPLPRRTARRAFYGWAGSIVAGAVVWAVLASATAAPLGRALPVAGPVLLVLGSVAAFVLLFIRLRSWVGDAFLDELAAGYTTLPLTVGAFWGVNREEGANYADPWDFRGIWVLDGRGAVRSAPQRDVDPPGLYPSPERPGQLQVWTGKVWARKFRSPARTFVDEEQRRQP